MKIIFIQTGGTIDKDYPHTTRGWAFEFGEPAAIRILERLDPSFEYEVVTAFQKDSLEITDKDRQKLVDLILQFENRQFIITHGTDTMIETGLYLKNRISDRLIILTGAMRPERFTNTDAAVNLGCALGAVSLHQTGIYLAMHGLVKEVGQIKRNMKTGKYY